MTVRLQIDVSFGQLAVFRANMGSPFNDWTDGHVAQGFSWRDGSVSFRTIAEAGPHEVEVAVVQHLPAVAADVVRAIEVPFSVRAGVGIEVASIGDSAALDVADGEYVVRCEFVSEVASAPRVRLILASSEQVRFRIVRADAELTPRDGLITDAQPAG